MRRLSDSLARGFARLPGDARYRRLAVMPFSNVGESAQKQQIGTVVAAELATDLRRDHNLLLIERQKLTEVMGELRLQQSGAVDPASAAQIGKIADAQALVIGSASDLGDRYLVNVRVVATETGETLAADSTSVQAAGMVALASDAVVLRSRKDAVFRSLLIPGWGQIYNRQQAKGFVILGAELALIGSGVAFHIAGDNAYNRYTSATSAGQLGTDPSGQAQRLYDTAVTRYRLRNGLLIGAAGLWMLNILDAYLSGVDGDAMLSGGMASRTFRF
jgi:TolB-like protein